MRTDSDDWFGDLEDKINYDKALHQPKAFDEALQELLKYEWEFYIDRIGNNKTYDYFVGKEDLWVEVHKGELMVTGDVEVEYYVAEEEDRYRSYNREFTSITSKELRLLADLCDSISIDSD